MPLEFEFSHLKKEREIPNLFFSSWGCDMLGAFIIFHYFLIIF